VDGGELGRQIRREWKGISWRGVKEGRGGKVSGRMDPIEKSCVVYWYDGMLQCWKIHILRCAIYGSMVCMRSNRRISGFASI